MTMTQTARLNKSIKETQGRLTSLRLFVMSDYFLPIAR